MQTITIAGGATASGVGVGATRAQVRRAFPYATADHGTEQVFGITLFTVPRRDGGRFQFAVEASTGRVVRIGISRHPVLRVAWQAAPGVDVSVRPQLR